MSISYDAQGNPTNYLGHTLTWEKGRQLKQFDSNTYNYNANGIRTSKTIGGIRHDYLLEGSKILRETWDDNTLVPLYDNEDSVCGIIYNTVPYYFLKNQQGDIIAITNQDGDTIARYSYDAWGVCTILQDTTVVGIAAINPFRYRGYYYDAEIGMYYLQSRYYNPVVGRFVNADKTTYLESSETVLGYNMFAYCENKPANMQDTMGTSPNWIQSHYSYNKTFTVQGYLNGQSRSIIARFRFGNYYSNYNGCGWIATYNAFYSLGRFIHPAKIIRQYESTGLILRGLIGVMPWQIVSMFKSYGYRVTLTYNSSKFDTVAKKNLTNILLFAYCWGMHYVACNYYNRKYFRFYNVYGNDTTWWKYSSIKYFMSSMNAIGAVLISIR